MKKENDPKIIKLSDEDLKNLQSDLEKNNLNDSQRKILLSLLEIYCWLAKMYEMKKLSLKKLKRLFSFKTEKLDPKQKNEKDKEDKTDKKDPPKSPGGRPKGSGRKGKDDLSGAKKVFHKLDELKKGDLCPDCLIGKVYPVMPGTHIQFTGQAPLEATVHETEKLRCNACGKYFEASLPEECKDKYHPSADVAIAIQKYALGLPFYRMGKWQGNLGIPIAPSSQWDRCEVLANSVFPVYEKMVEEAADGDLFHGDDTRNKILDVQKYIRENNEKRVGVYTTGIISKTGKKIINLFFTGRQYCGENMNDILKKRKKETSAIFMSDALAMNLPKEAKLFWANCLTHCRRNFWDYRDNYPKMVPYVLSLFSKIYKNEIKTEKMLPQERLSYHQKHSGPIIEKIRRWGIKKLYLKKIEPNEELGGALKYFFKHFKELTLFLRVPGVPLDNNIVERLLKTPILNRKNSYFYKTQFGALVGDVMMSLIETCKSSGINPQKYLLSLHEHREWVKAGPEKWLPWNFEANLSH
ncbi:IS66 family transposase [Candidatus Peregrinibacteria bacterium]|jgi:transposase|nr:IS66 family transposase [Candidatus Peregrinibacteria bacterium]MBT6756666.1 IS66 family transposase [Candidatus Paceibacterota bacterium]